MTVVWSTRPFIPADAERLTMIFRRAVLAVDGQYYSQEERAVWARGAEGDVFEHRFLKTRPFVAATTESNEPIGFAELSVDGYIDCFYVDPRWQGQGVARALLSAIEVQACGQNIIFLSADVALNAQLFFTRSGFVVSHENRVKRGSILLINHRMIKRIQND